MNILMMTNTYKPIVGGLEKSVEIFSNEFRKRGHNVLIVTPETKGVSLSEENIIRIPAIQNFNKTDFSVKLPVPLTLSGKLRKFRPQIVHSQHPFLIGDTALRISAKYEIPVIFTHHTLYEQYTHYVPVNSNALKRFVIELSTGYANLCDCVFAPSRGIKDLLEERGVETPIEVIPTGIYLKEFLDGDGKGFRKLFNLPEDAFIIGYAGRVTAEKNLLFLSEAVISMLKKNENCYFLLVGDGSLLNDIKNLFRHSGLYSRLYCTGILEGEKLRDAYYAMNVFAFTSKSETQGLVLMEAMASGVPVVAVDAIGVREVVKDGYNGRLLLSEDACDFTDALEWIRNLAESEKNTLSDSAKKTALDFAVEKSVEHALGKYEEVIKKGYTGRKAEDSLWESAGNKIRMEWDIASNVARAVQAAVKMGPSKKRAKNRHVPG
ncbi:MAG: glycosyltransferase [Candidatus Omnitrophota bacterium]